jgi:hypothetical protein
MAMLAALSCHAGLLRAQDSIRHTVSVEIDVPHRTDMFQVIDIGGWSGQVQQMAWDNARQRLLPLRRQLQLKSTGCMKASLSSRPRLSNRDNEIALGVWIGGLLLPEPGQGEADVVDAAGAPSGKVVELTIEPGVSTGGYRSGLYQGVISILFEPGCS